MKKKMYSYVELSQKDQKPNPTYRSIKRYPVKAKNGYSKMTCEECGGEYIHLVGHISQIHGLKTYKLKYGIEDNRDLYPPDFLQKVQEVARKAGVTPEAVSARTKYWSDEEARKDKSKWMKEEQKRRFKDPEYKEKWTNGEFTKAFIKNAKERHEKKKKEYLSKRCVVCGDKMPLIYHNTKRNGLRIAYKRKTCSDKCYKSILGKWNKK